MGQPFAPRPSGRPIPRALGIWPTAQSARNLADRLDSTAQIKPPTAHPATASFHPTATITTIGADATAAATNSIDAAKPTRRRSDAGWFGRGCGVVIAPTVVAQAPPRHGRSMGTNSELPDARPTGYQDVVVPLRPFRATAGNTNSGFG